MVDVFGNALFDFYTHRLNEPLWLFTNDDPQPEEMPLEVFFRTENELNTIEHLALEQCKGSILDMGAGAGAISLILQQRQMDVEALEINAKACKIMRDLGVQQVINQDIWSYHQKKYDTLLMLMNGIGLCEKLNQLPLLLRKLSQILHTNGQILFDSSDISYLYPEKEKPVHTYFGEIEFLYQYKNEKSEPFHWLYVDVETVRKIAHQEGFNAEIIFKSTDDEYLMRLKRA